MQQIEDGQAFSLSVLFIANPYLLNSYISILRRTCITYRLFIFFVALFYFSNPLFAQPAPAYTYHFYNTQHGLPSPEIICLAKDHKGFLWLGTAAGISMYDGYNFHNYAYTKQGELIGYVNVIRADGNRLWIGSGAGLFCFINNTILKISGASSLPQGVNDILVDNNGTLWLATENGPVLFHTNEIDFSGVHKIVLSNHIIKQWTKLHEDIDNRRTVLVDRATDGTIYIAQWFNLYRLSHDTLELMYTAGGSSDKILSLFPVSRSKIYFDGASTEINRFENGVDTIIRYRDFYRPGDSTGPGKWYVGTRGAFYFHPQTGIASIHIAYSDKYVVWATAVLQDDHFLWLATHDGLVKLKPALFTPYTIDKTARFVDYYSIRPLPNNRLFLGANLGKMLEKNADSFRVYKDKVFPRAEVKDIYEDKHQWLWVASGYQGLSLIRNNQVERFTVENGLHDNSFDAFVTTRAGKLYALGDAGVSQIIVQPDQSVVFRKYSSPANTSQYGKFFSGIESPNGTLWIGGEEGLAQLKNDSLTRFTFNGKQVVVNYMIKDKADTVWIATAGEGILQCVFNNRNELAIVKQFTEDDGLNTLHYLTLLADKDDNIWAGSSKGISFIGRHLQHGRILHFDESDGFIKGGYSRIRLQQDSATTIWAATVFGVTSFEPGRLLQTGAPPVVYINLIRQIKKNQTIENDAIQQSAAVPEFGYSNNSFNFNFVALDYANQENMRYYYQLEGLDTAWINSGNQRSVNFENLSAGNYVFRVKALNSKSIWSTQDAVYAFTITLPFWKTAWFLLLLLLGIALLAFWIAHRRIQFVKKREAEKTSLQQLKASGYRERLEIEQIINHFATSMNQVNNADDVLWDVVSNCISILNFEDCVIYLKEKTTNRLVQKAAWGPKTNNGNEIIQPIIIVPGTGIVGSVAVSGVAEIVNDTSLDARYVVDDKVRLSEITVPVMDNDEVIGIIDSEHSEKGFYTQRHLQILTTIASLCSGKIKTIAAEQQIIEKEMEVLRLNRDFATSQLVALRMQMNPHFIFNALNSVQHYILQGNVIEANKYLSKFSKLQREILHCSSLQFITLEKEIEILHHYLELEQNRFGETFTYHINMAEEIEPVEIKIPPMVLQPFVENAIWHGLMPRQTERILSIYFKLESDDLLLAILRDNGIGREASAKLKPQHPGQKKEHESKGMSLVQQRLQLLQQQYGQPFEATVGDIKDTNGVVQGTQVILKIFIGNSVI